MGIKNQLLAEFEKMESERSAIITELSNYPEESLSIKINPNTWSVAEVVMHLVVAEGSALKYMQKKLQFGGHRKAAFGSGLKQRLLNVAISIPGLKYKAPGIVEIKENHVLSYSDAIEKWQNVRSELRKAYESLDEKVVDHELFKHPAAGKMNVLQGLKFMRQHMNRHIKQMRETVKKVS